MRVLIIIGLERIIHQDLRILRRHRRHQRNDRLARAVAAPADRCQLGGSGLGDDRRFRNLIEPGGAVLAVGCVVHQLLDLLGGFDADRIADNLRLALIQHILIVIRGTHLIDDVRLDHRAVVENCGIGLDHLQHRDGRALPVGQRQLVRRPGKILHAGAFRNAVGIDQLEKTETVEILLIDRRFN